MRRSLYTVPLLAASLFLVAGCTTGQDPDDGASTPTGASTTPIEPSTTSPDLGTTWPHASDEPTSSAPPPSDVNTAIEGGPMPGPISADETEAARTVAHDCVAAFAAQNLTQEQWWSGFSAYLTPEAQSVWQYTDATKVPATTVTGDVTVVDSDENAVVCEVPTDAGIYVVTVYRDDPTVPWLISDLTPQES